MKNNQENEIRFFKVKISEYNGKFRFTIPAEELRKINAKIDDFIKIILRMGNNKIKYYARIPHMPKSRTNLQVRRGIPKQFTKKAKIEKNGEIELQISLIDNIRSNTLITKDNQLDILAAIPKKTNSVRTIMVDLFNKESEQWCKIWYCAGHGGKAKEVELRRYIKIDKKLGEYFGLMQAESNKKGKMFDFTNKFMSEIKLFIEISEKFGISKQFWNCVLYYNDNMKINELEKYLDNFSKELKIYKNLITTIKNRYLLDVVYNIRIPVNILAETMVNIMFVVRDHLSNQYHLTPNLLEFAKGFILKDLLGDGTVVLNHANRGLDIVISEQDNRAQKAIISILKHFKIDSKAYGIKIHISTNFNNCLWFLENNAFFEHEMNRKKLLNYILNNYYFNSLFSKIRDFKCFPIQEFANKHNLSYKTAQMFLLRNKKRGYFVKKNNKTYDITEKGKDFIRIINNVKNEMTIL